MTHPKTDVAEARYKTRSSVRYALSHHFGSMFYHGDTDAVGVGALCTKPPLQMFYHGDTY